MDNEKIRKEILTLWDLVHNDYVEIQKIPTGIYWIDEDLDGGIQPGQLIAILGDSEAGKTQLINQILLSYAKNGKKSLYFSLEFGKKKVADYFHKKYVNGLITEKQLKNVSIVTDDMTETDIDTICDTIEKNRGNYDFVAIDSTLMLYDDKKNDKEAEITEIFRKLHKIANKNDVTIFLITQASKEDIKGKKISIFGSQRATHFCDIIYFIAIERDEKTNEITERYLILHKNKQNGKYAKRKILFDRKKLEFEEAKVGINPNYSPTTKEPREDEDKPYDSEVDALI